MSAFDSVAYGQVNLEECSRQMYNPTVRLMLAMGMLIFPIVFYAIYQCCCAGEGLSRLKECMSKKKKTKGAVAKQVADTSTPDNSIEPIKMVEAGLPRMSDRSPVQTAKPNDGQGEVAVFQMTNEIIEA